MPSYTLICFDQRGLRDCEVARQILYLADVPFEDIRVSFDEWPEYRDRTPFSNLPILEVDGKAIPQPYAMYRYLAKEHGFAGVSPYQRALVDALADQHKDFLEEILTAMDVIMRFGSGSGLLNKYKETLLKDQVEPASDKYFPILEKIAKGNEKNGFFIGASLTWVDLLIADCVSHFTSFIPGHLDAYPALLATVDKINATPKLAEWIEIRPESEF